MSEKATVTKILVQQDRPPKFVETTDSFGHSKEPEQILVAKIDFRLPENDEEISVSIPVDDLEVSLNKLIQIAQREARDQLCSKKTSLEGQALEWS